MTTNERKYKLNEQTKIYKKYFKNINVPGYEELLNERMIETHNLVLNAKENYYKNQGSILLKMPIIPPMFENGVIVTTDY